MAREGLFDQRGGGARGDKDGIGLSDLFDVLGRIVVKVVVGDKDEICIVRRIRHAEGIHADHKALRRQADAAVRIQKNGLRKRLQLRHIASLLLRFSHCSTDWPV